MSARLNAILIPVWPEQFEAVSRFYAEGFTFAVRGASATHCWLEGGGATLMLHVVSAEHPEFAPSGHGLYLEFSVDDLDASLATLLALGGATIGQWRDGAMRCASLTDPAGNMLELFQRDV